MLFQLDISEDWLYKKYGEEVFSLLLKDHTTHENIYWATDSYEYLGEGYSFFDPITIEKITGENDKVIRPRAIKSREEQTKRAKNKAEVFTPSWICNAQNNLIDEAWFGRKNVFNYPDPNDPHKWIDIEEPISFPDEIGKSWKDYVCDVRMEITCGEGPYLVSRYDTTTGTYIPLEERIGILDRKLRIVSENTDSSKEWLKMARMAYKSTYAFEWQGDNLLLTREALLISFIEYFIDKFGRNPMPRSIKKIAEIISWNVWQMDGLRGVVPNSCKNGVKNVEKELFGRVERTIYCKGCKTGIYDEHNGTYCVIREWIKDSYKPIKFVDLFRKK